MDRQDAAIHRLEEKEVVKTAKSEERLDAAVRRLEEKEMKEDGGTASPQVRMPQPCQRQPEEWARALQ